MCILAVGLGSFGKRSGAAGFASAFGFSGAKVPRRMQLGSVGATVPRRRANEGSFSGLMPPLPSAGNSFLIHTPKAAAEDQDAARGEWIS